MTTSEYNNLYRFDISNIGTFENLYKSLNISVDTIFQLYTINNNLIFIKVVSTFFNTIFDLKQCTESGENIKYAIVCNGLSKNEIINRIYCGDWKLYKL